MASNPWTQLPQAAKLLADCAENPPATRYVKGVFGPNDGTLVYSGSDDRVKQLRAIWKAERSRLFAEAEVSGDYAAWKACCSLTVQDAVEGVVEGRSLRRAA